MGCGGLLLDPGLGKTAISLMAFCILKRRQINKKMLVVAPLRPMISTWPGEMSKWKEFEDFRYVIIHGPQKEACLDLDADIYLINPEAIPWLCENGRYRRIGADVLCVDESTRFKNSQSKRFKALKPALNSFTRRWILTGSPAPNGLMDLFGQIYILDQGHALERFVTHFRLKYFFPSGFGGYEWTLKAGADREIAERIKPITLRLKAEEWLDMPELITTDIVVELPPEAKKVYQNIESDFITQINSEDIVAANAAVASGKCRQIANGALYSAEVTEGTEQRTFHEIHDAKLEALEDLLEELQGQPLFLLYEFDHDRERIQKKIPGTPALGQGSLKKDQALIDGFNAGSIPLLLAHPGTGGIGLNLQARCSRVAWFGITWNLEHYIQSIARIWRQGQTASSVIVYRFVAKDTLDEIVVKTLGQKDKVQESLLSLLRSIKRAGMS